MKAKSINQFGVTPMQILLAGYCIITLIGTFLLSLPIATKERIWTPFTNALFTATSATCVTGLVQYDTYAYWSLFGQIVILILIQIGGIGFMTLVMSIASFTKVKIGLDSRTLIQNSLAAPNVGGMVKMTRFVLLATAIIEGTGALLLTFHYCPRYGFLQGIYFSIFHSISAFCNAGFDLMGIDGEYSSLTHASRNPYVNFIVMILIIIGGLGFFVWKDLIAKKGKFKKLRLHSKIVIATSVSLILGGTVLLLLFEIGSSQSLDRDLAPRILQALFQSVTARTAGFNTVNIATLSQASQFLLILLMFIGGSTGSTAGGVKTTTFAVLIASIPSTFRHRKETEISGRRLDPCTATNAACIFMLYLILVGISAMTISSIENMPILDTLFESVSAIGTVGISTGITGELTTASKYVIIFLMLFGRAGSLTMLMALSSDRIPTASKFPHEKIQIG